MKRLVTAAKVAALLALLIFTWAVDVYHLGVFPVPTLDDDKPHSSRWISRAELRGPSHNEAGLNHLVLRGGAYGRGLEAGKHTAHLLLRQEQELTTQLHGLFKSDLLRRVFEVLAIRWFWGIEKYFEPWTTREMYGVSKSAPHEFDYLADGFTRQISYHGLHEVGQLMVDQGGEDMGCTVVALPYGSSWVLGRNFDFEGGRIFDTEKIVKWVFPDEGYAFVSVIWAGMVGAVTGVNEHGVYVSLNAAGSRDLRRHGTPSTLVLLKALQFARTAEEAVRIISDGTMFITDIFVVADPKSARVYRVEKSPKHTEVLPLAEASIVTNHLIASRWASDSINQFRKTELTSGIRAERGERLLAAYRAKPPRTPREAQLAALAVLRDKGEHEGKPLLPGNRRAIDALIATHAVVYDAGRGQLFVSQGPGLAGKFLGYDLKASFAKLRGHYYNGGEHNDGEPVRAGELPRDHLVSDAAFAEVRASAKELASIQKLLVRHHYNNAPEAPHNNAPEAPHNNAPEAPHNNAPEAPHCNEATRALGVLAATTGPLTKDSYVYAGVLGDVRRCAGDMNGARQAWTKALALAPAYPRETKALLEKLKAKNPTEKR